ncbi:MAG: hypothetical protein JW812_00935 [Alphaproteobacteria bacterium]|nr:hypothetical protein [Alphaproteobacteria bacterium]MBN2780306.1 hypothetical protein [Alphaproteobacteria bacterium]
MPSIGKKIVTGEKILKSVNSYDEILGVLPANTGPDEELDKLAEEYNALMQRFGFSQVDFQY